jgi:hypothetical protein
MLTIDYMDKLYDAQLEEVKLTRDVSSGIGGLCYSTDLLIHVIHVMWHRRSYGSINEYSIATIHI